MSGISPELHQQVKDVLLDCGPFDSHRQLQATFTDARIERWRNGLPEADTRTGRVMATIDFLYRQQHEENGLVLFLAVLRDNQNSTNACHRKLDRLIRDLKEELNKIQSTEEANSWVESSVGMTNQSMVSYLKSKVSNYEVDWYQHLGRINPQLDTPYKFLYPFEIKDKDVFFGRDKVIDELYHKCLQRNLTILHARSGAGKTSLLQAGLSPRLLNEFRLPVYVRTSHDPAQAIKRAIIPPSSGTLSKQLINLSLVQFLKLVSEYTSERTKELVVILDQFEEFFIFSPLSEQRQPFIKELAKCYSDPLLSRIRFIISLQKDYFSDLANFQEQIPTIFYNNST